MDKELQNKFFTLSETKAFQVYKNVKHPFEPLQVESAAQLTSNSNVAARQNILSPVSIVPSEDMDYSFSPF